MPMPRPDMRRTVILLPNGFTLASLFFGVFAIVAASRGEYELAGRYVVFGGVADALDGRVARATRTGTRFGEELDSLVDAITFGLAPTMIMYFAVLNREGWDWIFCFLFSACAVIRLARFNIEQAGRKKTHFNGLPTPAAGLTLATYYWFSQTSLYNETMIGDLPWHQMLRYIMLLLSFLMISNVSYPAFPTIGIRSVQQVLGTLLVAGTMIGVFFIPKQFFFPAAMIYVLYGVARTVLFGLMDRLPGNGVEPALGGGSGDDSELTDGAPAEVIDGMPPSDDASIVPGRRRRRRRRPRGDHGDRGGQPPHPHKPG
jgi:CDP-diacylglycerol---serine O-phosphatidyltransferase